MHLPGSLVCVQLGTYCMNDQSRSSGHQWDHRLMELIDIETWDWWKSQVYVLREGKSYAEAEALFFEFKL